MIEEILALVNRHEEWRQHECLNLIPSENVTSPAVRTLLSSDLGHRYTSPEKFYMGTRFLDSIQEFGEKIARQIFNSETADLRPLSGHIADLIFLSSFARTSDKIMCVSAADGGYPGFGYKGLARLLGLKLIEFPFSRSDMNIEIKDSEELLIKEKPNVIVFGASLFLFPHPVKELVKIAKEIGAHIGYDGSHVLGLIAGKKFQDPINEGVDVLLGSTHKTFFGPQGGIILANKEHGEFIKRQIHPQFVDNAHWNRIAALTLALAEAKNFGREYAQQVVRNAKILAKALADYGFPVMCPHLGFTQSHQVFLNYGGYKEGLEIARKLEEVNIIADCGVRLGTCEVTRRGMKEKEMEKIAEFIKRRVIDKENAQAIKREVVNMAQEFQQVEYCFK